MLVDLKHETPPAASPLQEHGRADGADRHYAALQPHGHPSLNILHVFRAPVAGLFRHVLDLTRGQVARGHRVGFVLDSNTGGARAEATLAEVAPSLALGISRFPMQRELSISDIAGVRHVTARINSVQPDVVHGHGAKGAAYARLSRAGPQAIRAYTPHGGSLVYRPGTFSGLFYRTIEWMLIRHTDVFLFESAFANATFRTEVGTPRSTVRIVHNGVGAAEFAPVVPGPVATDLVFIGELRPVKGVDLLIDAIAQLDAAGRTVTVTIVGDGPDRAELMARAERRGLGGAVHFAGAMPARQAFARARIIVVPSRAESLPYVVLEAAAAGLPIIATDVGGVAEIFGPSSSRLIPPHDPAALSRAIASALDHPDALQAAALKIQDRVRSEFSIDGMVEGVLAGYRNAIAARAGHWLTVS